MIMNDKEKLEIFKCADKKTQEIFTKYPDHYKSQSSHSLGAMINVFLQEKYDIDRSMNFNFTSHPHDKNLHIYARNDKNYFINKIGDSLSIGILSHSNPRH